jgi:hypothetical protein
MSHPNADGDPSGTTGTCSGNTGTAEVIASSRDAYPPKDRVPYEIWDRLIGEPKPGQE